MKYTKDYPLVSIVMATYNGEKYIEKQLESIFRQTYPELELIVVDDRSQDNTVVILNQFAQEHKNMKVFVNDTNLGYIKNFEKGCFISKGAFIALCDQDDYWNEDKIKLMVEAIGEYPMIYSDSFLCKEDLNNTGIRISDNAKLLPIHSCLQQAVFCRIYGHATLITRSLFERAYPFLEVIPHDWWLSYVASFSGGIRYLNIPLVYYRQHSSNLYGAVGTKRKNKKEHNKILERKRLEIANIRTRINTFFEFCPAHLEKEKKILKALAKSYSSFSIYNNFLRMGLFLHYQHLLLAVKKRSPLRKFLFCIKMFTIIK
jgi:glycosyltransferase involved in cell wall biosynthesis